MIEPVKLVRYTGILLLGVILILVASSKLKEKAESVIRDTSENGIDIIINNMNDKQTEIKEEEKENLVEIGLEEEEKEDGIKLPF